MLASNKIRVAIATNSLGKSAAGHDILTKIEVAKAHGFEGIEVAFECLDAYANSPKFEAIKDRNQKLHLAAEDVQRKATELTLDIVCLQPFGFIDALASPNDVKERLEEAELWLQLCDIMSAPILQVPSFIYPSSKTTTADLIRTADNMRRLGQLATRHGKVVGYEGVAWGKHVNTWEQIQTVIELVNLPNVRHCLDTFHIAAKVAGNPFDANQPLQPNGELKLAQNLDLMKTRIKVEDIAYIQLSDATVADPDQKNYPQRDLKQPAFMTQSRNCRIFPLEPARYGGTLPAHEVARALFDMGYSGWVSMEVFHTELWKRDAGIPNEWAKRGMESWQNIQKWCGLVESHSASALAKL